MKRSHTVSCQDDKDDVDISQDRVTLNQLIHHVNKISGKLLVTRTIRNRVASKLMPIHRPLIQLQNLVGMYKLKSQVVDLLMYVTTKLNQPNEYYHCIITGSPGLGKSTVIEILAEIYAGLGITKSNHIVRVKRKDLVAKYLGQTAHQTTAKLEEAIGGVLVMDEAYQLATKKADDKDSYADEAINVINQYLSERCGEFVCMLAGYKDRIENVLSYNEGLSSRFPYRFDLEPYDYKELFDILKKIAMDNGWQINTECLSVIKEHHDIFKSYGRDMQILFQLSKIAVSRGIWHSNKRPIRLIDSQCLQDAVSMYKENNTNVEQNDIRKISMMYS